MGYRFKLAVKKKKVSGRTRSGTDNEWIDVNFAFIIIYYLLKPDVKSDDWLKATSVRKCLENGRDEENRVGQG